MACVVTLLAFFLQINPALSFYLPGVAPTSYSEGDIVPLHVNHLTPAVSERDEQVRSVVSFDYYHDNLHFCKPEKIVYQSESLGSILFGDRIQSSPFELRMKKDEECKTIVGCGPQEYSPEDAKFVNKRIYQDFNINWLVDGLPAGQAVRDTATDETFYSPGFALGKMERDKPALNNHYDIYISYHAASRTEFRVVGVQVTPQSNKNSEDLGNGKADCSGRREDLILSEDVPTKGVVFTYSVYWQESVMPFATRWDAYLHVYDPKIHWFSLINSAIIVLFLSAMVFVILVRTLKKDITRYNKLDSFALDNLSNGDANGHTTNDIEDSVQEDSGWKLIHGDVFRSPSRPLVLSILVGNGVQLFMMAGFTIFFALLGFLSPSNRGSLGSVMVLLYTLFSGIGGFVSSYTYKSLGGSDRWKENVVLTPLALPIIVFGTFFLLDLFLWAKASSGAVPFTTMLIIIALWFLISVPLSFLGSYVAFKRPAIEAPVRVNQIPRQIPDSLNTAGSLSGMSGWLIRPIPAILLTGIPPFIAIFFELYFIMKSLWSSHIYYMFGFLFISYILMAVTCATITVLAIYFMLCAENYHWQWRSFAAGGACSLYVFLNALLFWASRLSFSTFTSAILYLGYSSLISLLVFVLTGTIGFLSSWLFVQKIYGSIKVD